MKDELTQILISYHDDLQSLEDTLIDIEHLLCPKEDKSLEGRKQAFIEELREFIPEYGKGMLNDFARYWLEHKKSANSKMRWEREKTWDTNLRLKRWQKMNTKFSIVNMIKQK